MATGSYYVPYGTSGSEFKGTPSTAGPWSTLLQHGGPPSALVARAFERKALALGLPNVTRLTMLLFRPVPVVAVLSVAVEVMRPGKKVGHLAGVLVADGVEVGRATAVCLRSQQVDGVPEPPVSLAAGYQAPPLGGEWKAMPHPGAFVATMDTLAVTGEYFKGPMTIWFRPQLPLLPDEALSPLQRVALVADSGNGISFYVPFDKFTFLNADLTVNLHRQAEGDAICMSSRADVSPETGCGLVTTTLYDTKGLIGTATQTQVLESRL